MTVPVSFMENRLLSTLRPSQICRSELREDIRLESELEGRQRSRGRCAEAAEAVDDLTFIPCSLTRIPLVGTSYVPGRGRAE